MKKIYFSLFLFLTGTAVLAQDTTAPILNQSNRIIAHFRDTTGKFTQLARLLIDRGYDIDMKDRELGILRTQPSPLRGASSWTDRVEIKTIFRDSTITFSGVYRYESSGHDFVRYDVKHEVSYSKKIDKDIMRSWEEMQTIAELLKPDIITYSTVDVTKKALQAASGNQRVN